MLCSSRSREYQFSAFRLGALALLVLVAMLGPSSARPTEPPAPSLKIDDNGPVMTIEARNVALPDLLRELSKRMDFAVEGISALDPETKVTVSYKGSLEDVLRRYILAGKGFLTFYKGPAIDRIVILGGEGSVSPAEPASNQAATPLPSAAAPAGAAAGVPVPPPSKAPAAVAAVPAAPPVSPVNSMLQMQVGVQRPPDAANPGMSIPTASAASGQGAATPMAILTQAARQNVLALSTALRSVCIGPNCGQ